MAKEKPKTKNEYRMIFKTDGLLNAIHLYTKQNDITTRKFIEDACIESLKKKVKMDV